VKRVGEAVFGNNEFDHFVLKEWIDSASIGDEITPPDMYKLKHWIDNDTRIHRVGNGIKKVSDNDYGSITKWSFVFITRGNRDEQLKKGIDSVLRQNIPTFEIIIVGGPEGKNYEFATHIPFMIEDGKGWITRKKNLGCERARFENLVVLHDDMTLCDDWYKKVYEWGNNWEFCNFIIESHPTLSWFAEKDGKNVITPCGGYDWDQYVGGHCIGIKKFVWSKIKWNESLYWGQREDVVYSWDLRNAGYLMRIIPAGVKLS
jgi:hypothetical protein